MKTFLTILFIAVIGTVNAQKPATITSKYATILKLKTIQTDGEVSRITYIEYGKELYVKNEDDYHYDFESIAAAMNYLAEKGYLYKDSESEAYTYGDGYMVRSIYYIMERQD